MVARQITNDLRRTRNSTLPGQSRPLRSKGISFGTLARRADGTWDTRRVEGLPPQSLLARTAAEQPSLVVRPWQHSGTTVSLRELTATSLNQHHGIQATERFGVNTDPDDDGVMNELTRADVTALTLFQATLQVPGRVIPNDREIERAVLAGEELFERIGCTTCHMPSLPLDQDGWFYSEPGPYNPAGTLQRPPANTARVDLTASSLPTPRLVPSRTSPPVVLVPAYSDFKLHDITDPVDTDAKEALDVNQRPGSAAFFAGNRRFLTRRLWGLASQPAHFHHGLFTTIREAVLACGRGADTTTGVRGAERKRAGCGHRVPEVAAGAAAGNEGPGRG